MTDKQTPTVAEELHTLCADGDSESACKRVRTHVGELVSDDRRGELDALLGELDPANLSDEAVKTLLEAVKGQEHRLLYLADFEAKARHK